MDYVAENDREVKSLKRKFIEYEKKEKAGRQRFDNYWRVLEESIASKQQRLRGFIDAITEITYKKRTAKFDADGLDERERLSFGGSCYEVKRAALVESDAVGWNYLSCLMKKRWERFLLQDKGGRIYMEYELEWMKPILQAIKGDENILLEPSPNSEAAWDRLLDYFGLQGRLNICNNMENSEGSALSSSRLKSVLKASSLENIEKSLKDFTSIHLSHLLKDLNQYDSYFVVVKTADLVYHYGQTKSITTEVTTDSKKVVKVELLEPMKWVQARLTFSSSWTVDNTVAREVKHVAIFEASNDGTSFTCTFRPDHSRSKANQVEFMEVYGLKRKSPVVITKDIYSPEKLITPYTYGITNLNDRKIDESLKSHEVMKDLISLVNESAALLAKMENVMDQVKLEMEAFLEEISFMQRHIYNIWKDIIPDFPEFKDTLLVNDKNGADDKKDEIDEEDDDDSDDDDDQSNEEETSMQEKEEDKSLQASTEERIEKHIEHLAAIYPLIEAYKQKLEKEKEKGKEKAKSDAFAYFNVEGEKMVIQKNLLIKELGESQLSVRLSGRWKEQTKDIDEEGYMYYDVPREAFRQLLQYVRFRGLMGNGGVKFKVPLKMKGQMESLLDFLAISSTSLKLDYM